MRATKTERQPTREKVLGFGFNPEESTHHFLVTVPAGNRHDVLISPSTTPGMRKRDAVAPPSPPG